MKSEALVLGSCMVLATGCASSSSPTVEVTPNEPSITFDEPTPFDPPDYEAFNCDPNYDGACVPIVSYDLDCPDVEGPVYVVGTDIHGFDRDGDGIGCEPYP